MTRYRVLFWMLCLTLLPARIVSGRLVQEGAFDPPPGFGFALDEADAAATARESRVDPRKRDVEKQVPPEPRRVRGPTAKPVRISPPAAVSALPLIERDVPPAPLFAGPVPRDANLAQDATLHDVCCVGRTAVAVGDRGVVCVSADAGRSWIAKFVPDECSLRSVCFLTDRIGWVAGIMARPGARDTSAVLFHTRDGGETWSRLAVPTAVAQAPGAIPTAKLPGLIHVQFFGLDEAVAVSLPDAREAAIFRSADGGASWIPVALNAPGCEWLSARFLSPGEGLLAGTRQSYAAVMADQGILINKPQPGLRTFRGVAMNPGGRSWLVGDGGLILTSDNAGVSWQPPAGSLSEPLRAVLDLETVVSRGDTVLLAGTPGTVLLRSENAGADWSLQPLSGSGRIRRLCWSADSLVLAVGSFGQILRSEDAGRSWQTVRSAGLHAGVLSFTSNLAEPGIPLLGSVTADLGVRSVLVQLSQSQQDVSQDNSPAAIAEAMRRQLALSELSVSDSRLDWMFPRSAPEVERLAAQLLEEWNLQSDGRAGDRLPQRIAREIRIWKPAVIVIEPATNPDAIAGLIRAALPEALSIAAARDQAGELNAAGLSPWTVARVVERQEESDASPLMFDSMGLLSSLSTTTSLLTQNWPRQESAFRRAGSGASAYRIVHDAAGSPTADSLLADLVPQLPDLARRPRRQSVVADTQQIRALLLQAKSESAALARQSRSASADGVIAQLSELAVSLPEALALQQLVDLAERHQQSGNLEAWLAIQQELIRRFPESTAGLAAAETLFLFYSSAEARHARLRVATEHTSPLRVPQDAAHAENSGSSLPGVVQPQWQAPQTPAFGAAAGNSLAALHERWDAQAMTAWKILTASRAGIGSTDLHPLVRLRYAANLRMMKRSGENHSELAAVAQLPGLPGLFAQSELQAVHQATAPALPIINLARSEAAPFLDARLTDAVWESSQELFLTAPAEVSADSTAADINRPAGPTTTDSLVLLAWDEEHFYLAARLELPEEGGRLIQLASNRQHDDPHGELDRLELELDTDRDLTTSWQLTIDESGRVSERCWLFENWNPEWFVSVDRDDQSWRIEAAIPLRELSATSARPGDLWSLQLRRVRPGAFRRELPSGAGSSEGTALLRFIRPRRVSGQSSRP